MLPELPVASAARGRAAGALPSRRPGRAAALPAGAGPGSRRSPPPPPVAIFTAEPAAEGGGERQPRGARHGLARRRYGRTRSSRLPAPVSGSRPLPSPPLLSLPSAGAGGRRCPAGTSRSERGAGKGSPRAVRGGGARCATGWGRWRSSVGPGRC